MNRNRFRWYLYIFIILLNICVVYAYIYKRFGALLGQLWTRYLKFRARKFKGISLFHICHCDFTLCLYGRAEIFIFALISCNSFAFFEVALLQRVIVLFLQSTCFLTHSLLPFYEVSVTFIINMPSNTHQPFTL